MPINTIKKRKDDIQIGIILSIMLVWGFTFVTRGPDVFWAGVAGIRSVPLLLGSILIDLL
jgi:hypothetical protein